MIASEYVKIALHSKEVQNCFVKRGIVDLGVIYNILKTVGEEEGISYGSTSASEIVPLIDKRLCAST